MSPKAPEAGGAPRRLRRVAAFALGLLALLATVLAASARGSVDLTAVLLVVLAEVLVVAALSGPVLAAAAGLVAVVLVNWFLVPPYHTFQVASLDNLIALVVFAAVAITAAVLVEASGRARASAARAAAQAGLLGDVVAFAPHDDVTTALARIRTTLGLDRVVLAQDEPYGARLLASVGVAAADGPPVLDLSPAERYHLVAYGPERVGPDPEFLQSLAAAAVRAYEGGLLDLEQRRVAELAAIDRVRSALLASVGHDLRTPLAGLRLAVDSLAGSNADLSEADRVILLSSARANVYRLEELITNLLDMSRLEAGAVVVQPEQTRVEEVVARALLDLSEDRVEVDVPETLPTLITDAVLLERVLANLVSNALRHGAGSPVRVTAELAASSRVRIEIIDHGPGIPADQHDALFRPFSRLGDRSGPETGAGLGLTIARRFAIALGADLRLLPTPGGGVTAQVTLPATGEEGAGT